MGGGPESQINTWNFVRKTAHFLKKIKCSKQPKSKKNLTFIFHLVESQTRAVGGWGPMFGTKSQKNGFFGHLPLCVLCMLYHAIVSPKAHWLYVFVLCSLTPFREPRRGKHDVFLLVQIGFFDDTENPN